MRNEKIILWVKFALMAAMLILIVFFANTKIGFQYEY